ANACEIVGVLVVFPPFFRRPLVAFLVPAAATVVSAAAIVSSAAAVVLSNAAAAAFVFSAATDVALCSAVALSSAAAVVFLLRLRCLLFVVSGAGYCFSLVIVMAEEMTPKIDDALDTGNNSKSEILPVHVTSIRLNKDNYLSWSAALEIGITSRGRLSYITGEKPAPSKTDPRWAIWALEDSQVKVWIISYVSADIQPLILRKSTAYDMWTACTDGLDNVLLDGVAIATNWDILLTFVGIFILRSDLSGVVLLLAGGVLLDSVADTVRDDRDCHMDEGLVDNQPTARDHLLGQVYKRKKTDMVGNVDVTNPNPVSSPDDPSLITEELPIALRKGTRVKYTYILDDPFDDPPQLAEIIPQASPEGKPPDEVNIILLNSSSLAPGINDVCLEDDWLPLDETMDPEQLEESMREKEAHSHAVVLEIIRDIPDAEIKPPENVLFVCKLNPVTQDEDLEIVFSRFGTLTSAPPSPLVSPLPPPLESLASPSELQHRHQRSSAAVRRSIAAVGDLAPPSPWVLSAPPPPRAPPPFSVMADSMIPNVGVVPDTGSNTKGENLPVHVTSIRLNKDNYLSWSAALEIGITSRGRLHYITGEKPAPAKNDPKWSTWTLEDSQVKVWIISSVSADIQPLILRKSTAYEMWTILARMYGRKKRVLHTYQIKRSIYALRQGDSSVASFYAALKTKWEELDYHTNDDWKDASDHALYWEKEWMDRTFIFLGGLRDEYESIWSQLLNCDEIPGIEEVYARVEAEEQHKQIMHVDASHESSPTAFVSRLGDRTEDWDWFGY
ncbi:Peptidyl-prolyl cis-trans isomerase, partial [Nymphaea thermarum]